LNYLILSASDLNGGAAIAAYRLHDGLRRVGHASRMLVESKLSADEDVVAFSAEPSPPRRFTGALARPARTDRSATLFTVPWMGQAVEEHPLVEWADVINVHWVARFVTPLSLRALRATGKPVIVTLHDERAYTGGCHYAAGCDGFLRSCESCPQLVPEFQEFARAAHQLAAACLPGAPLPDVVAPSRWLAGEAARSAMLRSCATHVIPYGIDLAVFRPSDRAAAKAALGFPPDGRVVLVGSQNLADPRKGADLLANAAATLLGQERFAAAAREGKLVFAAFGKAPSVTPPGQVALRALGELSRSEDLVAAYNAADLFVCPSREDNLPNTVMEAMACGVPVLGTRIGGIPDMVDDGTDGFLVPAEDAPALAAALERAVDDPGRLREFGSRARAKCEQIYRLEQQAQAYADLAASRLRDGTRSAVPESPVDRVFRLLAGAYATQLEQRLELIRLSGYETDWNRAVTEAKARSAASRESVDSLRDRLQALQRRNPLFKLTPRYRSLRRELDRATATREAWAEAGKLLTRSPK
jgi:glycosyltransferase involved in cell wall biosynthesis